MANIDSSDQELQDVNNAQALLEAVLKSNEALAAQNQILQELLRRTAPNTTLSTASTATGDGTGTRSPRPAEIVSESPLSPFSAQQRNAAIWRHILGMSAKDSKDFIEMFFHDRRRPKAVLELLDYSNSWTSWTYVASFPHFAEFLKRFSLKHVCHCQLEMADLLSNDTASPLLSYDETWYPFQYFWEDVRKRLDLTPGYPDIQGERVSARLWKITNISPLALIALMGSTPRSDSSYLAAFVERHLKFSNWARVSLLRYGQTEWTSYKFEYHFAFYFVTPEYSEIDLVKPDIRGLRRSVPFGKEVASTTRYIHEETLSFLLVGHFKDVVTCVQLAESYFRLDKNAPSHLFRDLNLAQPPALMFLSWISVGFHHVSWRWQSAIEAVENEVKSSAQIVFMKDRNDLMADDPQFSLSRTYFYVLEAYKLFEETLQDTIDTWLRFKSESLPRLNDPRIELEKWNTIIEEIDYAVRELDIKVIRIRKRQREVESLRQGLTSASALFDSRTSVRQGENIRLLTYITILFFPLSFGTSIFGMQFMGSNRIFITAFAIALPAITVCTSIFVFNLQNFLDAVSSVSDKITLWLRESMRHHRRKAWKARAIALQEDEATTKAPVRKARRQSSGWVYLLFLLEFVLVSLAITEILTFLNDVGLKRRHRHTRIRSSTMTTVDTVEQGDPALEEAVMRHRKKKRKIQTRWHEPLEDARKSKKAAGRLRMNFDCLRICAKLLRVMLAVPRALLVPFWFILLLLEFCIVTTFLALDIRRTSKVMPSQPLNRLSSTHPVPFRFPAWRSAWHVLGLDAIIAPRALQLDGKEKSAAYKVKSHLSPRGAAHIWTHEAHNEPTGPNYFPNQPMTASPILGMGFSGSRGIQNRQSSETGTFPIQRDESSSVTVS